MYPELSNPELMPPSAVRGVHESLGVVAGETGAGEAGMVQ